MAIFLSLVAAAIGALAQYFYKLGAARVLEIPIYKNVYIFLGLISEKDIHAMNDADEPIGNNKFSFIKPFISIDQHVFDVIKLISDEKLSAVPQSEMCGWLKDKYGLSWQIVPTVLSKLLTDKDAKKSQRVMQAMLQMKKIEIADLEKAYKK